MKRIMVFLMLFGISLTGICQSFSATTFNPTAAILNTAVDSLTYSMNRDYTVVGIQPVITKATGTMAGTAVLYASLDGTNYVSTGDTLTLTNVTTNTTIWIKTNPVYSKYLIKIGGATTVTGTASAKIIGRKPS